MSRTDDQIADIVGWLSDHSSDAVQRVVEAGQAILHEREGAPEPGLREKIERAQRMMR